MNASNSAPETGDVDDPTDTKQSKCFVKGTSKPAQDRREAQKQRSREQILQAAEDLVAQQRSALFSVDELAARADVSRRTIFNHFASLDEVLITLASERLRHFVDRFGEAIRAIEPSVTRESLFDAGVHTLKVPDLLDTIAFFARSLGPDPGVIGHTDELFHATLSRTGDELIGEIVRSSSDLDAFDAEVAVAQVISGVSTAARHWARETDTVLTPESRERFNELLARVTATWPTESGPTSPR